ncbi:phenylacetate--CoA ligase family protein [Wenyingzhuangia sp. IMCC45533]
MFKLIFKIGQRFRNPSLDSCFSFLQITDQWSIEKLEAYQLEKIRELLNTSYKYSKFYRDCFDKERLNIDTIKTLNDLSKVPILEKKDLLNNVDDIHTNYKFKKLYKASTSGSTGNSLVFNREEWADSFNRASIFRGYSWHGVSPWDKNGYFWGFNFSFIERLKTNLLDFLQNRFRVFSYEKKSFERFVKKLKKAKYIHGYSSMIYQTAKLINESEKGGFESIKMVKGTSEKIYDSYQDEVKKAFNLRIISEYGATESGIIAFECPEGNMHINMEGCYVEEHNNEILVTNLQMKSFPVIRYKLGDYIELAPRDFKCKCGRAHRVLKEVTGRVGESVYGENQIYPSLYFYYIFKNLVKQYDLKLNYQVIQNIKGKLDFLVQQEIKDSEIYFLKKEIVKYFGDDVTFNIFVNATLENTGGKFKSFISKI